jgi:3',5'-cyclic AMP phosphodiesterase CpdA
MRTDTVAGPRLLALSDLHVGYEENRDLVKETHPVSQDGDWLLVAGDVGETFAEIEWALGTLRERFEAVFWVPGNHELWTHPRDSVPWRGEERYRQLVEMCRRLDVVTPEDPYRLWTGPDGSVTIVPLFLLYDYSFRPPGARSKEEGLAHAYRTGVVCNDEFLLHPDPYDSREAWCSARIAETERRLAARDQAFPVVLLNHFPLVREPTRILHYQEFAQWCGTTRTANWHIRYRAAAVIYGHLHIPRTTWHDGVRFEEVSVGYPREWRRRKTRPGVLRQILPAPDSLEPVGTDVFR